MENDTPLVTADETSRESYQVAWTLVKILRAIPLDQRKKVVSDLPNPGKQRPTLTPYQDGKVMSWEQIEEDIERGIKKRSKSDRSPATFDAKKTARMLAHQLRTVRVRDRSKADTGEFSGHKTVLQPYLDGQVVTWEDMARDFEEEFDANPAAATKIWESQDAQAESHSGDAANSWPRPFWLVLRDEVKSILTRRGDAPDAVEQEKDLFGYIARKGLTGLAFSGGGIRSATFNLGILQGLAELNILPDIDILSTVSGGGYAGAWFASWIQRKNLAMPQIASYLSPTKSPNPAADSQKPLRFLREFSNYLTPALGLFSFDTWTMAAIYLRNVFLNQITLLAGFGALLILPRLLGWGWDHAARMNGTLDTVLLALALLGLIYSISCMGINLKATVVPADEGDQATGTTPPATESPDGERSPKQRLSLPRNVQWHCAAPLLLSMLLSSLLLWKYANGPQFGAHMQSLGDPYFLALSLALFAFLSFILWYFGGFVKCFQRRLVFNQWYSLSLVLVMITALTAVTGTVLLRGYILLLQFFSKQPGNVWHAIVWGAPLLMLVFALTAIVQVGLMGVDYPDSGREWLSRFRAMTNLYVFFWLALFSAAIYGPWLLWQIPGTAAALGTGWIATTISAVLAGKSAKTGQTKDGAPTFSALDLLAKIGPPVFLVGFVLLVSFGIALVLSHPVLGGIYGADIQSRAYWRVLSYPLTEPGAIYNGGDWPIAAPAILFGLCGAIFGIFAWRVDINEFSMHHFYKNRLVRCYLGASNPDRNPNPFTGFDESDDRPLTKLHPGDSYKGPYHIVNATLNLSAGGQLAWQERKATSFIFTPAYSGFDLSLETDHPGDEVGEDNLRFCAYRKTSEYAYPGGIDLGTAMAISGAAADPNQGYNTSPAVAFLMTVFDVRLGWWLGNPRKDYVSKLSSPRYGLVALISTLLGMSDDRSSFVSLSDGGHFDNMGLYELIRRRCRYIILCDAEQDSGYRFEGLGMAVRKCRIDFGTEIDIDPQRIRPVAATGRSEVHCAVGTITYPNQAEKGVLVYIKSSLTGDEPEDVLQYAATKPEFPHETTADQWFSESQFESYRKLGYHALHRTISPVSTWRTNIVGGAPRLLFSDLQKQWYPLNPALAEHSGVHTKTLNDLFDKMRGSEDLHELGDALFPGGRISPKKRGDPAAEYFFCMTLIQLVEDIYVDFGLDREQWKRDPRIGGWLTIFRAWHEVKQIDNAWAASKQTFRKDFQAFWEDKAFWSEDKEFWKYLGN